MNLRAAEVFTPGAYPTHTYVERPNERLEQSLRDALSTPGQVVSLSGPSKSGKTVLVERVVGRESLITVPGAGVQRPDDIWNRVLDWMDVPRSLTRSSSTSGGATVGGSATSSLSVLGVPLGRLEGKGELEVEHSREEGETSERRGLTQVVAEIGDSDFVILLDDFHYMPRDVQTEAAKSLKEAVRLGLKICTAAVRHRGDDVVRANPELRGRVRAIDLDYWKPSELEQIALSGFRALNARLVAEEEAIGKLVVESAGSPQLMQLICLNACFVTGHREKTPFEEAQSVSSEQLRAILEQTSSNTDFRSLVDVLDAGPKTRGTERNIYQFADGSRGDVYRCILKALAADPPRLSFPYDELIRRTASICRGDPPVGSSVAGTCLHMSRLALEKFPNERAIDWDESKAILDIPDPYLLFYLRWSGRLSEE